MSTTATPNDTSQGILVANPRRTRVDAEGKPIVTPAGKQSNSA